MVALVLLSAAAAFSLSITSPTREWGGGTKAAMSHAQWRPTTTPLSIAAARRGGGKKKWVATARPPAARALIRFHRRSTTAAAFSEESAGGEDGLFVERDDDDADDDAAAANAAPEEAVAPNDNANPATSAAAAPTTTTTRIPRAEALRRMEEVMARKPTLSVFLNALEEVSALSGLPPARCVWVARVWGHASRRWALPELLAALKALDGAEVADLVRLTGQNGSPATALGVYKEATARGWCDNDGGAAMTAMAWTYDGKEEKGEGGGGG